MRKLPVPLIVSRYRHDGTGTVVHQHIVGDPDGYGLSRQRMRCAQPGVHAQLLGLGHIGFRYGCLLTGGNKFLEFRIFFGQRQRDGMLGCKTEIRHAKKRIWPGGVDFDALMVSNG